MGSKAIELMPADMSESGSIAVDTVAGATITSNAILEAVKAALTAAGVDPEAYNVAVDKGAVEDQVRSCDVVIVGAGRRRHDRRHNRCRRGQERGHPGEPGDGGRQLRARHRRHERQQDRLAGREHLRRGSRRGKRRWPAPPRPMRTTKP